MDRMVGILMKSASLPLIPHVTMVHGQGSSLAGSSTRMLGVLPQILLYTPGSPLKTTRDVLRILAC
jgi:hypothetical protein